MREWSVKLEVKPEYVVSSTRKDYPWTSNHLITGDLRSGVQNLKAVHDRYVLSSGLTATKNLDWAAEGVRVGQAQTAFGTVNLEVRQVRGLHINAGDDRSLSATGKLEQAADVGGRVDADPFAVAGLTGDGALGETDSRGAVTRCQPLRAG